MTSQMPRAKKPKLSIAVMAHPKRRDHVEQMIPKLDIGKRSFQVVYDHHSEGLWANAQRAWRAYDPKATHHLVIQDDLAVCKDLIAGAEKALAVAPRGVVSLFSGSGMIKDALERDVSWAVTPTVSWAQALTLPVDMIEPWLDWCLVNVRQHYKYDDARLAMYCLEHDLRVWHTCPTLVEHLGAAESLIGGAASIGGRPRHGVAFIGEDRSALEIDWKKGAEKPPRYSGHPPRAYDHARALKKEDLLDMEKTNAELDVQLLKLDEIEPYWNNPRVNDHAIDQVKQSIQDYGFNQPIVVDKNKVIIAGHTRYAALKKIGEEQTYCVISDLPEEKAREYRIADNKTGEMAKWDRNYLMAELREFENPERYFNEAELANLVEDNSGSGNQAGPTQANIDKHRDKLEHHHEQLSQKANQRMIEVTCESCGEQFALDRANALASADLDADSDKVNQLKKAEQEGEEQ